MSENITHTAITDDCARLVRFSPSMADAFKRSLTEHPDIARLGGITRYGDRFSVGLLTTIRDRWPGQATEDNLSHKLAFVLGWLCHRATDRQMKPLFRALDADCPFDPTDCSIYHDVYLLREIYGAQDSAYPSEVFAASLGADRIEEILRTMWQRALISLHTLIPDVNDVEGWLERLLAVRQRFTVDLRRYAEILAAPDQHKMRRFIYDINFYDPNDGLVAIARALQRGHEPTIESLDEALNAAPAQSQYARALRRAYGYIEGANAYFRKELSQAELVAVLEIGIPEV